jgi:prepilin-type N-terminal cleavage/methylation domain-containing protein/prepilin-type processing-associated H-X9-DG protein
MKRQAFTLIELLVVIAIIAILAAILFPVFAKARSKAQQTTCLSNCKQIALALNSYASDWNGCYPLLGAVIPSTLLGPYINSLQIWTCPSATSGGGQWPYSYVFNDVYWNNGGGIDPTRWEGSPQGSMMDASTVMAFADGTSNGYRAGDCSGIGTSTQLNANPPAYPDPAMGNENWVAWHFGKANMGFLDGHCASNNLTILQTLETVNGGSYYYYLCPLRPGSY